MRPRLALVMFLASLVALAGATPAQAAFPGANGRIAFLGTDFAIHTVNADGSGDVHVADFFDSPHWSPDGTKILMYYTDDSTPGEPYVVNADGSGLMQIATNANTPAWSPDGTRIAFWFSGIQIMNADGTGRTPITNGYDGFPAWSPDGRKIAFKREGSGGFIPGDIYTVNVDGSGLTNLTNDVAALNTDPDWSPDGTKIVYTRGSDARVWVMNADGTGKTQLTFSNSRTPAWSPDGQKIVYNDGASNIHVMNADGSGDAVIVTGGVDPDWQPLPGSSPPPPYPTPRLAAPIQLSLIPVFKQCGTPSNAANRSHSPPLSVGSCPPQPSGVAHFGPQAKGTAWIAPIYGDTNASNGDQADVTLRLDLTDIQTAAGADYDPSPTGADGTLVTRLRFTDRSNGGSGTDPGTATDFDFSVPFACTATSDTAVGSNCALDTSADAVNAGMIKENKATVLQVFRLRLNDSGANGVRGDGDDRLFATEGVFVP